MVACQPVHLPRVVSPLRTTVQTKSPTGRLPQAVFFSTEQPKQAELLQSESRCRISITLNLNNHSHAPKTTGAYMMEIPSCRCRPNSGTVQPAVRHGGGFGLLGAMRLAVQNRLSSYVPILIAAAGSILCKKSSFIFFSCSHMSFIILMQ